jgi:hypothetical protein
VTHRDAHLLVLCAHPLGLLPPNLARPEAASTTDPDGVDEARVYRAEAATHDL